MAAPAIKIQPVLTKHQINRIKNATVALSRYLRSNETKAPSIDAHHAQVCQLLMRMLVRLYSKARGLNLLEDSDAEKSCDFPSEVVTKLSNDSSLDFFCDHVDTLGEIYEWLLKQYPSFTSDGSLDLSTKTTKARKHSGSYYTPMPLVEALLDRSLDPLLEHTADPLSLRILDPSVGTGRFLLAAARRISASSGLPIAEVIKSCLFGADTNPTAVEVCIASLCLEARDMSLAAILEKRILVGNLLLGTSFKEVSKGVPEEAYQPMAGDDPKVCRALRLRNAELREQLSINPNDLLASHYDNWCSAFVQRKSSRSIMSDALTRSTQNQSVYQLTQAYQFLHPTLAFSDVMSSEQTRGRSIPRLPLKAQDANDTKVQAFCRRDAGGPSYVQYGHEDSINPGFDLIIGNPPYVPLYSRKSAREDKQLARSANLASYLNRDIEGVPALSGRINTFLLFLSLGARLIKKGGTVAYVLPDSFATNQSYEKTRRVLIEKGWLKSFTTYTKASFGNTAVRTSLLVWSRSDPGSTIIEELENLDSRPNQIIAGPADILHRKGATLKLKAALNLLEGWIRLGDIATIKDGINPGTQKTRKRIVAPYNELRREHWKPAIIGNDIEPMKLKQPSIQVCYDQKAISSKEKKAGSSLRDPRIFEADRIVYRQTANRPIACICPAGIYTLNSVHNVLLNEPGQDILNAICGYLNTDFCARIYADMTGETRNLFPQVHASSMRQLPLPPDLLNRDSSMHQAARISVEKLNDLLEHLFQNLNG